MTARGRIIRGVGAGLIGQGVSILGRILLIPLFLDSWGTGLYGEWLILSSAVAFLTMTDLGGQVYFVNRLTSEWTRGERDEFDKTLATAWTLFLAVPLAFAFPLAGAALLLPIHQWLGLSQLGQREAALILIPLALQMVAALPQGLLLGIYRAIGMQASSVMLGNAILTLQLLLSGSVLLTGGGLAMMAWVQLFPFLLVGAWAVFDLRARVPGFRLPSFERFSARIAWESIRPSAGFLAIQLTQLILQQATVLLVGRVLGAQAVVVFSTVRTVVNSLRQLLGLVSHSAWPEFTRREARVDGLGLQSVFYAVLHLTMLFAFLAAGALALGGPWMMDLWLGGRFPYPAEILHHFSIYVLISLVATLTSNVLMATNRHHGLALGQLLIAGVGMCGFAWGLDRSGLAGGILGLLMAEAVPACAVYAWLLLREDIGIEPRRLAFELCGISGLAALAWWSPVAAAGLALSVLSSRWLLKALP